MSAEPTLEFLKAAEIEAQTPITAGLSANEQLAKQFRYSRAEGEGPEGTSESLLRCATMLDTYAPDLYPANEQGQVSFSRAMMESVADEIRMFVPRAIAAERERDALQAFKAFVHGRLDQAGIPTHPDGPHSKEGCRIGDRLDIALAAKAELAEAVRLLRIVASIAASNEDSVAEIQALANAFLDKHGDKT